MTNHIRDEFGTCKFCGFPWTTGECAAHAKAKPAMRACEALGLKFVEWNERGQFASYASPGVFAVPGVCERMYAPTIERVLRMIDDPEFDATDAAHPAWWRGCDHGCKQMAIRVQKIIGGCGCPDCLAAKCNDLAKLCEEAQR